MPSFYIFLEYMGEPPGSSNAIKQLHQEKQKKMKRKALQQKNEGGVEEYLKCVELKRRGQSRMRMQSLWRGYLKRASVSLSSVC